MTRVCQCGADISHRNGRAVMCLPCGNESKRASKRAHKASHTAPTARTNRCLCCRCMFVPTRARTRLCLPCWSGGEGVREHSIGVAV